MSSINQDTYFTDFRMGGERKIICLRKRTSYLQLTNGLYSKIDIDKSIIGNLDTFSQRNNMTKGGWLCRQPQGSLSTPYAGEPQS